MKIARVMVNLSLDRAFDYLIPEKFASIISPGTKVEIPFGKSIRKGVVVSIRSDSSYPVEKLKAISDVLTDHPKISEKLLFLADWMAAYYCAAKEQTIKTLLPAPVRTGKIKLKKRKLYYPKDPKSAEEFIFNNQRKKKVQCEILKKILSEPGVSDESLSRDFKSPKASLNKLIAQNLITEEIQDYFRNPFEGVQIIRNDPPELTTEQNNAINKIISFYENNKNKHATFLLHGVTGSGKTEVYLQILQKIISDGKDAIVLVPEIALTPQTTERFRARFGNEVSVLHSALSDGERHDEWMRIHRGSVKIAVGARSALFAPFRNLGAIIVDEEHESSYKQEESPRYNARDMAVMRASIENAIAILGSATPSLESYYNTSIGKYHLCELRKRVDDRLMPEVKIVDMRVEDKENTSKLFSKKLAEAIRSRISAGEQTILFLNRKGFATQMTCLSCGWTAECPQCSVSYTYHKERQSLSCHLCGDIIKAPLICPKCSDKNIRLSGAGTEKIENICRSLFKGAIVKRMDAETMTGKKSYEKILHEFRTGKIQILVGTQMIAKGLDFPNVTLVGIVCADISLKIPDFRSEERTFQLLTQVAGRAGRGSQPGEVIIQTYSPSNAAIRFAVNHDYKAFFDYEIKIREQFGYPPFSHMIALHLKSENEEIIISEADKILAQLNNIVSANHISVNGPNPAPIPKIKGKFNYLIIFRGNKLAKLKAEIKKILYCGKLNPNLSIHADVDPLNLSR